MMNVKTKENGILEESLNKIAGSLNDILNDNLKISPVTTPIGQQNTL